MMKPTEARARSDHALKPCSPGRTISRTARKPMPIAVQRRTPTGSPSATAAMAVVASGTTCRIAVALAISRCARAVR